MNICAAGWHFHPPFVDFMLAREAFFVCHRVIPDEFAYRVKGRTIRNIGLEFGCYDWYLKNKWEGGPVFFTHDDNEITEETLAVIAAITHDQSFLFASEAEAVANGRAHGRAFFCSEKLLTRLKADGGFWYNEAPETSVVIPATSVDEPNYHNTGILTFVAWLKSLPVDEFAANQVGVVPGLKTGYRGRL